MDSFLFVGNSKPQTFLENALTAGNFGQSYCFSGLDQVGKRTLALYFAGKILQTEKKKLFLNPDFFFLQRAVDEKSGKLKKDISIEQTKKLKNFLSNRSWLGGKKVAIVDEAELFNGASGNALLKILEEPPVGSHIFLLTENDGFLLATIRSRCQIFYFSLVADLEISAALKKLGCENERAQDIARAAFGRPGRAFQLFQNEEKLNEFYTQRQIWDSLLLFPVHKRFKKMESYFSEKNETVKTKESLLPVLELWSLFARQRLISALSAGERGNWRVIDAVQQAKQQLNRNANARLVIEQLLMSF